MTRIYTISYRPYVWENRLDQFVRVAVNTARLIADHGIDGDAKAGRHPDRQLLLFSYACLLLHQQAGYTARPGDFGEQLVIQGLTVENLQPGSRLRLGVEAEIEITKQRTTCRKLDAVQRVVRSGTLGPMGMLARVTVGGLIHVGDSVEQYASTKVMLV